MVRGCSTLGLFGDSMHRGWIKLWRCITDNDFWQQKPYSPGQAWVDLMMMANHKEGTIRKGGVVITVKRGQVGASERYLAERWGWSRGKVRRFLNTLKKSQQVDHQTDHPKSTATQVITILNYDQYQGDGPADELQTGPQTDHQQYQNNKEKNEKKKIEDAKNFFHRDW